MVPKRDKQKELEVFKSSVGFIDLSEIAETVPCIPTGVEAFDLAMGGGFPEGRISELGGLWQSGKSLLAYQALAACQRRGGIAFLDDSERAFDRKWGATLGINLNDLVYYVAPSLEEGFEHLEKVCRLVRTYPSLRNVPVLYVKDSLEASISKTELDLAFSESGSLGVRARAISRGLRRLNNLIANSRVAVVFVNQFRAKISPFAFGPQTEETAGGFAPKYYAGLRVILKKGQKIREGAQVIGFRCSLEVIKSKIGVPFKEVQAEIYLDRGFPPLSGLLDFLVRERIIVKVSPRLYRFKDIEFQKSQFEALWAERGDEIRRAYLAGETAAEPPQSPSSLELEEEGGKP